MATISAARMMGRIEAVPGWLMNKYQLQPTQEVNDVKVLLVALGYKLEGIDQEYCFFLATQYENFLQEVESLQPSEAEFISEKQAGNQETNYIFPRYQNNYGDLILQQHDYLADIAAEEAKRKAKEKKTIWAIAIAVVIIVLGLVVYNLPYFSEKRAYEKVLKAYDNKEDLILTIGEYVAQFPNGKHVDDVIFTEVKWNQERSQTIETLHSAMVYLNRLPNGQHAQECRQIIDNIWNQEISRYEKVAKDANKEAAEYVLAMLRYMKANNIYTVTVDIKPTLKLKEYSEYPYNVRTILEAIQPASEPKLLGSMITIKDKVTYARAEGWGSEIVEALQKGFNSVLTPDFITFVAKEDGYETSSKNPLVVVDFTVETQEFQPGYPDIWTYTHQVNGITVSQSLLLGIAMKFDAKFSLPDNSTTFFISGKGNPGDQQITGEPESGYSTMCERCTLQFADKLSEALGIAIETDEPEEDTFEY